MLVGEKRMVVDGTGLKNAVIGVAGLAVFRGALRLRLPSFLYVLPCILCYAVGFGLGISGNEMGWSE